MTKLTFHTINFLVYDDVNITPKLKEELSQAARKRIQKPYIIGTYKDGERYRRFANIYEVQKNLPAFEITIDGIKTCILIADDSIDHPSPEDIEEAIADWTGNAAVRKRYDRDGYFIDFD